jgi:hypothetical protein
MSSGERGDLRLGDGGGTGEGNHIKILNLRPFKKNTRNKSISVGGGEWKGIDPQNE